MENNTISVIIAVYNAEKYLDRCMHTLLNQTYTNLEILLINDGSTDGSGALCDRYAAQDSRVKVFHRTNHGVGATRQFGLKQVTGQYVIHADSDDWLELDMLEKMYHTAETENADMVICDYMLEHGNRSERIKQVFATADSSQRISDYLNRLIGTCWNKLIKVNCIKRYNVDWEAGVNYGEDQLFNLRLLQNPLRVAYCPDTVYHYDRYSNNSSYTLSISPNMVYQRVLCFQKMHEYQTTGFDNYGIPLRETETAFLAIRTNAYTREEFYRIFAHLKDTNLFKLPDIPFHMRLIVWSAFYINYRTAERLMAFKLWYRRRVKRISD